LLVTIATVLYFVILLMLKVFPEEDLALFKRIVRGKVEMR